RHASFGRGSAPGRGIDAGLASIAPVLGYSSRWSSCQRTLTCMTLAIGLLRRANAGPRIHSSEQDPKSASYGLEAAEKLGLDPARVFKTLLACSEKNELLVAVVPVGGSLDLKALAQAAQVKKVDMADPMVAQRTTGYLVGGISPLGQKKRLRTFIDQSAQAYPTIHVSAGRRGLEVELAAQVLAEQTGARFAAIGRA